jgi:DNA-binding response OmpR family regulator
MRVLIIDNDHDLADLAKAVLSAEGFAVDVFNTLEDGRLAIETTDYDTVILDLTLPDGSGLSLLEEQRKRGFDAPVLMLSAHANVEDRIKGLDSGCDDYLAKPFVPEELVARVRAITRRLENLNHDVVLINNVSLNTSAHEVLVNGEPIRLSKREWEVFSLLAKSKGKPVSRKFIIDQIYDFAESPDDNALEAIISRLRKNLKKSNAHVAVRTHRGEGYSLNTAPDLSAAAAQ